MSRDHRAVSEAAARSPSSVTGGRAVSIVVPAYNEESLLPDCLRSLARLQPSDGGLEIIVVDNHSTDGTSRIAEELGATVLSSSSRTVAGVRNDGARLAHGSILAFLDADCVVEDDWLVRALKHFETPQVVGVGAYPQAPPGASWLPEAWAFLMRKPGDSPSPVAWLTAANVLVRAVAFQQVRGFDESLESCEDVDLCYRLRRVGALVYDPAVRAIHRREPKTLRQFFYREVWHGKHSYDGIRAGRLVAAELPSVILPAVALVGALLMSVGLLLALAGQGWRCFWNGGLGLALPAALYTTRAVLSKGRLRQSPAFLLIYVTYFLARGTALLLRVLGTASAVRAGKAGR